MLSKIFLLSVTFPASTWAAWANMHQSHLVMQMVFGIFISLGIFFAVLCMSEGQTQPRMDTRLRAATAHARSRSRKCADAHK